MKKTRFTFTTFRNIIIVALLMVLSGVMGYRFGNDGDFFLTKPVTKLVNLKQPLAKNEVDFSMFWQVWGLLEADYLEPEKIQAEDMVHGAVQGMTASLGDPYTAYLPPVENQRKSEDLAGSFFGVGIELGYIDETLAVVAPLKGMPAEQAGVKAGDLILHVKDETKGVDEDTAGWSLTQAVEKIRGKRGVPVELTLFRKDNGMTPFVVSIVRDQIVVESVELEFVEHQSKRVAHLSLSQFGERTAREWNQAVREIVSQKDSLDGVVFDLRNNPGGFLDLSIELASDFISSGTVVTQKGKYSNQDYKSVGTARLSDIPVNVLVNRGSASASEIVAGAMRDRVGAKLIGEKTFGKGTVQDRREFDNGAAIHITVARWLLPNGEWIHEEGIPVDIEVEDDYETEEDEVLLRAIEEI